MANGKITSFFAKSDSPIPIRWSKTAEPPKKRAKRGPGRPKKIREPQIVITLDSSDSEKENEESENAETNVTTLEHEDGLPLDTRKAK